MQWEAAGIGLSMVWSVDPAIVNLVLVRKESHVPFILIEFTTCIWIRPLVIPMHFKILEALIQCFRKIPSTGVCKVHWTETACKSRTPYKNMWKAQALAQDLNYDTGRANEKKGTETENKLMESGSRVNGKSTKGCQNINPVQTYDGMLPPINPANTENILNWKCIHLIYKQPHLANSSL